MELEGHLLQNNVSKGGILMAVSQKYHSILLPLATSLQAVAAQVWFETPITLCSLYLHPQDEVTVDLLEDLIR